VAAPFPTPSSSILFGRSLDRIPPPPRARSTLD
jgi:hypothetical protein